MRARPMRERGMQMPENVAKKSRILTQLALEFMKIGLFTFGGGYAMIAMIENSCVGKRKWITHLELFLGFLKVGCFAFGGAYGAIPLIRDVVMSYGWLDSEQLAYMIAVSESTPGPIMVNLATFVGSRQGGFWGAMTATAAVVLPSFAVILIVTALLRHVIKNKYIQAVLKGVKPCIAGIILATGLSMAVSNILTKDGTDIKAAVISLGLLAVMAACKRFLKKKLSPLLA